MNAYNIILHICIYPNKIYKTQSQTCRSDQTWLFDANFVKIYRKNDWEIVFQVKSASNFIEEYCDTLWSKKNKFRQFVYIFENLYIITVLLQNKLCSINWWKMSILIENWLSNWIWNFMTYHVLIFTIAIEILVIFLHIDSLFCSGNSVTQHGKVHTKLRYMPC